MENISKKSRTAVVLLSGFLGVLGIHRFYVGRNGSAVIMLLLSLTYFGLIVTAIWNLVDFIMALSGNFKDKEGKMLKTW